MNWTVPPTPFLRHLTPLILVGVLSFMLWASRDHLAPIRESIPLFYTFITLFIAIWLGTTPSLLAAGFSFICYDFLLIEPYYTLAVKEPQEWVDLTIFFLVALASGQLASKSQQNAAEAQQRATEQKFLYTLSSTLNQATGRAEILANLKRVLEETLHPVGVFVLPTPTPAPPAEQSTTYVLLQAGETIYGTLVVTWVAAPPPHLIQLLQSCAFQGAMALQRIELSEKAQKSRTLEEADRLKTAILHAVSHDLRTPLTIIKTSASNLRLWWGKLSAGESLELVQTIDQEVDHLNVLVGNLLDMSRLKAGAMTLNLEQNELSDIVGEAAARQWQRHKTERLELQLAEDMPLLWCDYGLLLQALSNIVDNAVRYEPAGRKVLLTSSWTNEELTLKIINHGPNIPDEEKHTIMEPFYHGQDGHTGLGLAISQGIIQIHHGRVWVEDTAGGGATFIIQLPLRPEDK